MLYSKNKKRGFTLVELIVVLVILAILAALLIPALTGYIDKAKKDQVIAETRMLHEAVQTEMVELYGAPKCRTVINQFHHPRNRRTQNSGKSYRHRLCRFC